MNAKTTIVQHLVASLKRIGVKHAFGVPGDYALDLLDRIIAGGIEFIGTCNELNAGYAADGYARAGGVGVAIVTYNVGGLSILNAVAGAYAEQVPMVVISGAPHSAQKSSNALVHHLAGGYNQQLDMFKMLTVDAAVLDNPKTAAADIRRVLEKCLACKRPVYLEIPVDAVDMTCDTEDFEPPPAVKKHSDADTLSEAVAEAAAMINSAKNPVVIVGVEIVRFQLADRALKLVETVELPYATTISSKSVLPELHPQFIGVYQGGVSRACVREQIEASDCVISLGVMMNDFNSGFFTSKLDGNKLINAQFERIRIKHHNYDGIQLGDFLDKLLPLLAQRSILQSHPKAHLLPRRDYKPQPGVPITVRRLFERVNNLLDDKKIIFCDAGDSICAAGDLYIEEADNFISQAYYLSIGYSLPAALGVSLARPDMRSIVMIGDGAFQMTAQELSTIIRNKCNPIIFILNNKGYVIERMIHDGAYNDIQNWQYSGLAGVFGSPGSGFHVHTEDELEKAVSAALAAKDKCALIDVDLGPTDCSDILAELGRKVRALSASSARK